MWYCNSEASNVWLTTTQQADKVLLLRKGKSDP